MKKCNDYRDIISQYIKNELNELEREQIQNHLNGCDECKKLYFLQQKLYVISKEEDEIPDETQFNQVRKNVIQTMSQNRKSTISLTDNPNSMIGKTISHYKILDEIGQGGMGIVYKVEDTDLKRLVALKFLPPELTRDAEARERFIYEAQSASALDHPNICTIHEIGKAEDGQLFITMGLYEGETLKEKIKNGPLKIEEAVEIAIQLAKGLDRAHEEDIVHRDIKPANIIITKRNEVKILDFGLAKLSGKTKITKSGSTLGTAAYMSPEQSQGAEVDQRTDIWSLGVVLYEMLAGQLPFEGEHELAVMYSIMNTEPEPLTEFHDEIPKDLEEIVNNTLVKEPDERYQNINDLLVDLESFSDGQKTGTIKTKPFSLKQDKRTFAFVFSSLFLFIFLFVFLQKFLQQPTIYGPDPTQNKKSVAVMYFDNLSDDTQVDILRAGMTETIITTLAKFGKLNVRPRSEVLQYKDQTVELSEIRDNFAVDAVIQGSIQIVGNLIRISTQLLDVQKGTFLWADKVDVPKENILDVQDQISQNVAKAMGINVEDIQTDILAIKPTENRKAFDFASIGIYHFDRGMYDLALAAFDSALAYDQDYSLAQYNKGQIYQKDKKYELAINSYNRALPKSEKFNRILWNWSVPEGDRKTWDGSNRFPNLPNNMIIGTIEQRNTRKTTLNMFALDKKELLWSKEIQDFQLADVEVFGNNLIVNSIYPAKKQKSIYAFDIYTGDQIWEKNFQGNQPDQLVKIEFMTLYPKPKAGLATNYPLLVHLARDKQHEIQAIQPEDKKALWQFDFESPADEDPFYSFFHDENNKLFVLLNWGESVGGKNITCINNENGDIVWETTLNKRPLISIFQNNIIISSRDSTSVVTLDGVSGDKLWNYETESPIRITRLLEDETMLLIQQKDNKLTTLNLDKSFFDFSRKEWEVDMGEGEFYFTIHKSEKEETTKKIFAYSRDGDIQSIEAKSGKILSKTKTGFSSISLRCIGRFVIGNSSRNLFMINPESGEIQWKTFKRVQDDIIRPRKIVGNKLITYSSRLGLGAYDLEYGDLLWNVPTGGILNQLQGDSSLFVGSGSSITQLNLNKDPEKLLVEEKKILEKIASCYSSLGNYEKAKQHLHEIIETIDSGYPTVYQELANVYEANNELDQAAKYLMQYSDFFPPGTDESIKIIKRFKDSFNLEWNIEPPNRITLPPVIIDSLYYVGGFRFSGDEPIRLLAIHPKTGETVWQKSYDKKIGVVNAREFGYDIDNIYTVSDDHSNRDIQYISSIKKLSDITNWQREINEGEGARIRSALIVKENLIHAIGENYNTDFIISLRKDNGEIEWKKNFTKGIRSNLINDNQQFIYSNKDSLFFLDRLSGKENWIYTTEDAGIIGKLNPAGLLEDRFIFKTTNNYFVCLDIKNRKQLWKIKSPSKSGDYATAVEFINGDTLYDWDENRFYAFMPDSKQQNSSQVLWQTTINGGIGKSNSVYFEDQYIYIKTKDNGFLKLNQITGQMLWQVHIEGGLTRWAKFENGYFFGETGQDPLMKINLRTGVVENKIPYLWDWGGMNGLMFYKNSAILNGRMIYSLSLD